MTKPSVPNALKKVLGAACIAVATMIATTSASIAADLEYHNIPKDMEKPLLGNALSKAQINQPGVLRLTMDKPTISELEYTNFVFQGFCAEQWRNPERFAAWSITKVELLNSSEQDGFAFDSTGDICAELGHSGQSGQSYREKIAQRTTNCTAGNCQ